MPTTPIAPSVGLSSDNASLSQPSSTFTQSQLFPTPSSIHSAYTTPLSTQFPLMSVQPTSPPATVLPSNFSSVATSIAFSSVSQYPTATQPVTAFSSAPPTTPYNFSSPSYALTQQKPTAPTPAAYTVPQPNYQPILTPAFSPVAPPPATIVQTNVQPPSQAQLSDVQNANFISSYFSSTTGKGDDFNQVVSGVENNFQA